MNQQSPTVVTVPCFSGAPWDLQSLGPLGHWPLRTMRLPEAVGDIESYADLLQQRQVDNLDRYVPAGDSFGAAIGLALAVRRPAGLEALVLPGGSRRIP